MKPPQTQTAFKSLLEMVMECNKCNQAAALLILQKQLRTRSQRWIGDLLAPWFPNYLFHFQDAVRDLGRCRTDEAVKTSLEYAVTQLPKNGFIRRFFFIQPDLALEVFDRYQHLL